ncbi:ribose 5-phosphate isomerase B [Patescibacteria group bacterium]|nr:ribose 5-phosphate isomerase B [Patescibacteria group bacterium]
MLYIAADHAGYPLKEELKKFLAEGGYEVIDLGADQLDLADDYPDYAQKLVKEVLENEDSGGVLICGTGQGMCIAANRFEGVRAAFIYDEFTARSAAEHLDANAVCLGARVTDAELAKKIVKIWLDTEFSGEERHRRRLEKIEEIAE